MRIRRNQRRIRFGSRCSYDVFMKYQWLENLESAESRAWVEGQNQRTLREFQASTLYQNFYTQSLKLSSSDARLPCCDFAKGFVYDVVQSADQPLGLWRRCAIEAFSGSTLAWEDLFDLDQFAAEVGDEWNLRQTLVSPNGKTVLMHLSWRGRDSHWVREFDLEKKDFVADGFEIPLSKSTCAWLDQDRIVVGGVNTFDQNELGYPMVLSLWERRGGPRTEVLRGQPKELGCAPFAVAGLPDGELILIQSLEWDERLYFLFSISRGLQTLQLPKNTGRIAIFGEQIVFQIQQDSRGFIGGSVLRVSVSEALQPKESNAPQFEVVWAPSGGSVGVSFHRDDDRLLIVFRENISSRLLSLCQTSEGWKEESLSLPSDLQITEIFEDLFRHQLLLRLESFVKSPSLWLCRQGHLQEVATLPLFLEGDFVVKQEWVESLDGTSIPYFIVSERKSIGRGPTLLHGYGGFGLAKTPSFNAHIGKLWLEHGGTFVVANIRGGSEFGPNWHFSARRENKQRSYDDFIAVAEDLIDKGFTKPHRLAIYGRSNGGLLVGAVAMQRPELFSAVLCVVPLLDMLRFADLPPGGSWVDEFGDPRNPATPEIRAAILKYSPYHNINPQMGYPPFFFMTARTDDRVHPGHARKMTAKLQSLGKDCFFYEESSGGHLGGNAQVAARDWALKFTYLWQKTNS